MVGCCPAPVPAPLPSRWLPAQPPSGSLWQGLLRGQRLSGNRLPCVPRQDSTALCVPPFTACSGALVTVRLPAETESPGQGGGRTQAQGDWASGARAGGRSGFSPSPPSSSRQPALGSPLLLGPPGQTPGVSPASGRGDGAHPSRGISSVRKAKGTSQLLPCY